MANKNYLSGRRFEYDTIKDLKAQGWHCIRASGSHGEYDVVAYRKEAGRKPLFIQCKVVTTEAQAKLLCKKFKESTESNNYFHQWMLVKVKGSKTTWRQEV